MGCFTRIRPSIWSYSRIDMNDHLLKLFMIDKYTFEEYYRRLIRSEAEQAAETDVPDWLKGVARQKQIWTIATMNKGETAFLIAGDSARNKFMVLPGGGYVTIEIRLPKNWDALIAPMGYEPLSHFVLDEDK